MADLVGAAIDWAFIGGTVGALTVIFVGWAASFRVSAAEPVGTGRALFGLPGWAQIGGGLISVAIMVGIGYLLWLPVPFVALSVAVQSLLRFAGLAVFVAGIGLLLWARWTLGAMWGLSTTMNTRLKAHHQLIQHGPYALVRHPLYTGLLVALAGATLAYRTWMPLLMLVSFSASFYGRARREEDALAATFGSVWRDYAARVPRFVPRLKRPS